MTDERHKLSKYRLDQNAIDQVELYEEATDEWAAAVLARDLAKEDLTTIKADVDEEIRANPEKYGWEVENKSPTEAWIAGRIVKNKKVKEATITHLKLVHEVNQLAGKKEALDHRKKMLEILTELYRGQYFVSVSRSDDDYKKAVSDKGKEAQKNALNESERMKRRRYE